MLCYDCFSAVCRNPFHQEFYHKAYGRSNEVGHLRNSSKCQRDMDHIRIVLNVYCYLRKYVKTHFGRELFVLHTQGCDSVFGRVILCMEWLWYLSLRLEGISKVVKVSQSQKDDEMDKMVRKIVNVHISEVQLLQNHV